MYNREDWIPQLKLLFLTYTIGREKWLGNGGAMYLYVNLSERFCFIIFAYSLWVDCFEEEMMIKTIRSRVMIT